MLRSTFPVFTTLKLGCYCMTYLSDVRLPMFLMFLLMLSNSVQATSSQQNSCQMTLLVNDEIITVLAPEKSKKVRINLPSGNSIVNLQCSLTQQAVFSFDRDEIVEFTWDDQGGLISQIGARNPSFVLPVGQFSVDFEIVSHHFYSQHFVWQDFASYVNQSLVNNITMGAFYGLCFTLILYVFFMGRILGDKRFELYSLYVFCASTFFLLQEGQLNIFLPKQAFLLSHQFYLIFAGLTVFTATIFIVRLIDLNLTWPKISYYGLHCGAALVLAISIAMVFLEHNAFSSSLGSLMAYLTLIIMLTILSLVSIQSYRGVKHAWLVLLSLLLMVLAMVFRVIFNDISHFLNRYALMIAFSIEAFVLAIVVSSRIKILKLEKTKAQIDANTDVLCEVLNRRGWEQNAAELLILQKHNEGVLGLLYIDINDFKLINDTYGHDCGDKVLQIIAKIIQNQVRSENVVGRIGGDEFVVLGHFDNHKEANLLASRMGARLSDLSISIEGLENVKVSASVGHVMFDSVPDSISMMLKSADKSMYSAKKEHKSSSSYVLS